jgi:DNA-binding GntR family transcriptional regulator
MPHGSRATAAYDAIRAMIVDGRLAPGDRVHEEDFAARLGVSRTPVREAISRLVNEGLIARGDGAPTVHRLTADEVVEILNVRRLLEGEAARQAAGGSGRDQLLALRRIIASFETGAPVTAAEHRAIDDELHETLCRMARSRVLADLIRNLRLRTRVFDKGMIPERFVPGAAEHIAIIDAVIAGDAAGAEQAMRTHIENVTASILAHLKRTT